MHDGNRSLGALNNERSIMRLLWLKISTSGPDDLPVRDGEPLLEGTELEPANLNSADEAVPAPPEDAESASRVRSSR